MANYYWIFCLLAVMTSLHTSEGYKILIYALNMKSHYIQLGELATGLIENKHDVHMLVPSHSSVPPGLDPNLKILTYPVGRDKPFTGSEEMNELMIELLEKSSGSFTEYFSFAKYIQIRFHSDMNQDCEDILNNEQFFNQLQKSKYDLVILDAGNYVCPTALIYKLGAPLVATSLPFIQWSYGVPVLPSVAPMLMSKTTNQMSFSERFRNLAIQVLDEYFLNTTTYFTEKYVPEKPVKSSGDILRESVFWFYMYDSILHYPRPNMPNTLEISDIVARPGAALPHEYEDLMQNAKGGVVLMALGSYFDHLPKDWTIKFCDAFRKINSKITILWKTKVTPDCELPENVVIRSWVPQNDVLAHPNMKLFITHCGQSSYTEAVYHAKPMIAIPLSIDQPHNAQAMQTKGLGIKIDVLNFTTDELVASINEVLSDPSYAEAAQKLSLRMRHKPMPTKRRIALWIEHVIKFGGDHLRSSAHKLSLFEFLMLDVLCAIFLFCVVALVVFVFACILCSRICKRLFCRKRPKPKTE